MTRTARNAEVTPTFFRVDGADQETGQETYLVLQAATKPQAEKLARKQGLLISSVRVARPDDWASAPPEPPAAPSDVGLAVYSEPPFAAAEHPAHSEPLQEYAEPPAEVAFQDPPEIATPAPSEYAGGAAGFVDAAPGLPAEQPHAAAHESGPSATAHAPAGGSSAAAVVLACVGGALLIGGVLALSLALWPDNAVRNELQQIDYRLHEVSQTILGSMLVLGGMMTFTLAIICYLLPRRPSRP